jgi:hypothetical protein
VVRGLPVLSLCPTMVPGRGSCLHTEQSGPATQWTLSAGTQPVVAVTCPQGHRQAPPSWARLGCWGGRVASGGLPWSSLGPGHRTQGLGLWPHSEGRGGLGVQGGRADPLWWQQTVPLQEASEQQEELRPGQALPDADSAACGESKAAGGCRVRGGLGDRGTPRTPRLDLQRKAGRPPASQSAPLHPGSDPG